MNGLPYYKAYPRAFFEGTIGMPLEMKGPYRLIIDMIYMQGGSLPDDARYISGLLGCSVKLWNKVRAYLIEAGKIEVRGEFLGNFAADRQLETLGKFQDKQRENRSRPNKNNEIQSPRSHHKDTDREKREAKASHKKRGSRLPESWVLPKTWGEWAASEGWPETVIRIEAEKFRDYWHGKPGKDGVKLDWLATWRNWMRNSKSPKSIDGGTNGKSSRTQERVNAFIAGARGSS